MTAITVDNAGVALHVERDGDPDAPPVLLMHGITNSTAAWQWLVPHLAADHHVLRLDFRGHGRSGRAPGTYGMPAYISDAAAVCTQLARQPCILIGHSLGGGTAAALAQQRPDLVSAIALEDPPLSNVGRLEGNSLKGGFATMRQSVPRLQARGISVDDLAGRLAGAPSPTGPAFGELLFPDALIAMATAMLQLDASVLDPVLEGTSQPAFDVSRPLTVPTLLLAADSALPDAVVQPAHIEQLLTSSPHARIRVIGGAGHLIHDELAHRQELLDELLAFLAGCRPTVRRS